MMFIQKFDTNGIFPFEVFADTWLVVLKFVFLGFRWERNEEKLPPPPPPPPFLNGQKHYFSIREEMERSVSSVTYQLMKWV